MHAFRTIAFAVTIVLSSLATLTPGRAQVAIDIQVDLAPPPLPVYDQPPIPADGYLWEPGYWAWDDDIGYYWVPGTWVLPPEPGLLWTPGYWGWDDAGVYVFHTGYWGPQIGFYGGVYYGYGYDGVGYEGGYWSNGAFFYNRTVNNFSNVTIINVYSKTVVVNRATNVSFNGGSGGLTARPTPQQLAAARAPHTPPTSQQLEHVQAAAKDPALALNNNQGHPTVAATARAADFKGAGVVAAHPGQPVAAIEPQGHRVTTPRQTNVPAGNKGGPTNAAIPTNQKPETGNPQQKGSSGVSSQGNGHPVAPSVRQRAVTTHSAPTTPGTNPHPQGNKLSTVHPTPQISKPTPPPQTHVNRPPPQRTVSSPPPRPPAPKPPAPRPPAPKKCPPGQHC
jgi:WXXGXW repeat (2 copies)